MKKKPKPVPVYKKILIFPLILQSIFGLLSSMIMDYGITSRVFFYSVVAYWSGVVMIVFRRSAKPTKVDLLVIRWGPILCFIFAYFISPLIWSLRGAF